MVVSRAVVVPVRGAQLMGERWDRRDAAPTVVMLHSGVTDRRAWSEVAARLSSTATVVASDRRGFGDSPPPTARFSRLDDLMAVLDSVAAGPAWLVGSSAGGGPALIQRWADQTVVPSVATTGAPMLLVASTYGGVAEGPRHPKGGRRVGPPGGQP
jgi:pimeloyl-ACP methyl ester carboxylesterase